MTNFTWNGMSGDWGDSNWTATGSAAPVDTETFNNDGDITVTGAAAPGIIQLHGSNLTLDGYFTDQPGDGQISDSVASGTASALTIGGGALVQVSQLNLSNTRLAVDGSLFIDGGNANLIDVEGSDALVGVNNSLSVGMLLVKNGAAFSGNVAVGNGDSLHVDDQSNMAQGTVLVAGSSYLYVSSTINGAQEVVQFSDNIILENNSIFNVSGDFGINVALTGFISGNGTLLTPGSNVAIDGTLEASGGTLAVGNLSGTGNMVVGSSATLEMQGYAKDGLTVTFTGNGTLTVDNNLSQFGATIVDFATSDTLVLPVAGVTSAQFSATSPGAGLLNLFHGATNIGQVNLSGVQAGEIFNVGTNAAGATIVTASMGSTLATVQHSAIIPLLSGTSQPTTGQVVTIAPYAQSVINTLVGQHGGGNNEWYMAGDTTVVGAAPSFGFDFEVAGPNFAAGTDIVLTAGYHALIAEGTEQINLLDTTVGNSLLAGNSGGDILVTSCNNDTLVGASGSNTVFYAGSPQGSPGLIQKVNVQGGGNDIISITNDNALISTSTGRSQVFVGSGNSTIVSSGHDVVVCNGQSMSQVNVTATGTAQDTVFGSQSGSIIFTGSTEAATVVGEGGAVTMTGGASDGNLLWAGAGEVHYTGEKGSAIVVGGSGALDVQGGVGAVQLFAGSGGVDYTGGSGAATIVGGSGTLHLQAGAGAMQVFGGSGGAVINGTAGNSAYIVGEGASTVSAAAGNVVLIDGTAPVSVHGADGVFAYGGNASGNIIFNAGAGSETLCGGTGYDTFIAGNAGNGQSVLLSGGGHDVFDFANGQVGGTNVIGGFLQGNDTISLNGYGDTVPAISVHDNSSYINLGNGAEIVVYGVTNLSADAFHFS